MKPLVLFDMDGTILNSVPTIAESCNAALAENGLPQHPLPAYNGMVGNGMRVLIRRACPAPASSTPASPPCCKSCGRRGCSPPSSAINRSRRRTP